MNLVDAITCKKDLVNFKEALMMKNYRDYVIFTVGINTGFRISDILNLKVADVRKDKLTIREEKTGNLRSTPINESARTALEPYIVGKDDSEWLFPSRQGTKPVGRIQIWRSLNAGLEYAGLSEKYSVGTHTMRKTFGYWHYKANGNVAMLMELFGHSSQAITLKYIGIHQENLDTLYEGVNL